MEIPRGWEVLKAKILKGLYWAKLEFPEGWRIKKKNLPWEGYGYFLEQHIQEKSKLNSCTVKYKTTVKNE